MRRPQIFRGRDGWLMLAAATLLIGAGAGCKRTNTCRTGTALLDLQFATAAAPGDEVDITVDVLDAPHETMTGTLSLIAGANGGTVEVRFKSAYRPGARVAILARAMRAAGTVEELHGTATLDPGCSYITVRATADVTGDGGTLDVAPPAEDSGGDVQPAVDGQSPTELGTPGETESDGGTPPIDTGPPGMDAAVDRVFVDVGSGSDGPCPGACRPGETLPCGKCGTKTCTSSCAWGACSAEGDCLAGTSRACGNCGLQVCDTTCHWDATCRSEGACKPGASMACGNCGHRTCSSTCSWQECGGDGQCAPGATRACGKCGTESCGASGTTCGWSGVCQNEGACVPGSSRPCGIGNCGSETCGANCQWSGACQNPGECIPGDTGTCGNCGTRTCATNCHWPTGASACTGQGACAPGQKGNCGNCGTVVCASTCQWPTDAASCTGQGVCQPGDTVECGRCGTSLQVCTASCAWGLCKLTATTTTTSAGTMAIPICPCDTLRTTQSICPQPL